MITIQDVEKLASLSRLALTDSEKTSFLKEIDSIIGYVANINTLVESEPQIKYSQVNILRDDVVINNPSEFTDKLLDNSPEREGNYVKVKKILE